MPESLMGGKGKTWLYFDREPKGTYDALLEFGPLPVGMEVSIENTGDAPGERKFKVLSTTLDINRYAESNECELFFSWRTRLEEVK